MFPTKPYKKRLKYLVYFKSIAELRKMGCDVRDRGGSAYNITHTTGHGGGLTIPKKMVKKYFGTKHSMEVSYYRQAHGRYIFSERFQRDQCFYDEMFLEAPEGYIELEDDLFEI